MGTRRRSSLVVISPLALVLALVASPPLPLAAQTPPPQAVVFNQILTRFAAEDYRGAITELEQLIAAHPDFDRAYAALADAFLAVKDPSGGEAYFRRLLGETPGRAGAHYGLARIDLAQGRERQAIGRFKRAIELDPGFVPAYSHIDGLPAALSRRDELPLGVAYFRGRVHQDPNDPLARLGLGVCYAEMFEPDSALPQLVRAVALQPGLAAAYAAMIRVYGTAGRYRDELRTGERLRDVAERGGDRGALALALNAIGHASTGLGDYGSALRRHSEALAVARDIGDRRQETRTLITIGIVHHQLGEPAAAREFLEQALALTRRTGDESYRGAILNNLAVLEHNDARYDQALRYYEAGLELARARGLRDEEAALLANIGLVHADRGDGDRGMRYYRGALALARATGDREQESFTLSAMGELEHGRGRLRAALDRFRRGLAIAEEIEDVELMWNAYSGLGQGYAELGDTARAIDAYGRAIALYDSVLVRRGIASLGSGFLEGRYEPFPRLVSLLATQGRVAEAFANAEKYKAKSLQDFLSQGRFALEALLPDSLRARLAGIETALGEAHAERSRLLAAGTADRGRAFDLGQRVTELELQRSALVDRVRTEFGAYFELAASEAPTIDAARARLEPGQALIEYLVGPERLSMFVLTTDSAHYREAAIGEEELARLMSALNPAFAAGPGARSARQGVTARDLGFSVPPAADLYAAIMAPVADLIEAARELIIVPDGSLFYLPFEALVVDRGAGDGDRDFGAAEFLIERYAISYSPSASGLARSRRIAPEPGRTLLALGNPDFSNSGGAGSGVAVLAAGLPYAGAVVRDGRFVPLPYAETEVRRIRRALGGSAGVVYVGRQATEAMLKREAPHFRIIHLATHFVLDDRQPLYSGLALARDAHDTDDGFLQTYEVFNLHLDADMVVLSACNTALGKLSRGEGLMGITRAFRYAGVPSLVVSLWSVDDAATSGLMQGYYRGLKAGLDKPAALRLAKLEHLRGAGAKADPYYWAPFIIFGDTGPLVLPAGSPLSPAVLIALATAAGLAIVLVWRRRRIRV